MSVNKNCMFALALKEGESTHISAIDNFQFWNNSFTLTMSFFQTGESNDVVLFNQEGIIKVGYNNSIFYVKVADKEFLSEEGRMVVMPKVWNSISVAYDISSKIVSAYINGVKDFEADVSLEGELPMFNSAGDYVLGEKFIGYFRKVFCYAGIHTEDEMFQISNVDPVDASEHEFYLDFSAKEPKDIGKYGKNIFTTCFAFNKNIIPTVDFGESGYISSEGSEEVLSDDYTKNDFTIVSKIYISDSRTSHILFAKENEDCNGFFIGVFCTDGSPRLFFKNGETNVAIDRTLPLYTWLDLAFVYSNKKIQVYCDGEEFGECELPGEIAFSNNMFTIGNAATKSGYKSFCGYIDYVAIFNGVKAKEELGKYISDIPYIYSKNISALYYLSDINTVELINSKKITINESICCFAEDTQRVETDMLTYDNECENDICISSYDQWQGSLAAGLFLGSISSMGIRHRFGLDSNGIPTESVAREFTKRVSSIPEHMEICLNSTSITPAMTQSYLSALESAGILGSLGTLFGISSFEVDKFAIAILGAAAVGACSVLIATACTKGSDLLNNENTEPPEQDPEDEKTVVYLKSITFAHNPQDISSAVYLRRSENQNVSEWDLGQSEAADALYIADRHENISVKATIVFNKPFVGTIFARAKKTENGILGDLEETPITVDSLTYPAEIEVSLKLARANFHDVKLGSYIDNLTWTARSEKEQIIFGTITHRTWILETEPLEQWNILEKDAARNISVDTLKFLDDVRKYDSSKEAGCILSLTDTDSWLKQMVHFVHDNGMFEYNYESEYKYSSYREVEDLSFFDIRKFEKDYYDPKRTDSIILSSLDASNLIVALAKLLNMSTVGLKYLININNCPISTICDTSSNTVIQDSDYILFSNAYVIGAETMSQIGIYNQHFVVCSQQKDDTLFYDGVISVSSNTNESTSNTSRIYLYGKKFTCDEHSDDWLCLEKNMQYYRESCITPGTNCHYAKINIAFTLFEKLNEKESDSVKVNPQVSKVAIVNGKITKIGRVEQFEDSMKAYYGVKKNDFPVLAHKVSYSYIQSVIVHTIELYRSKIIDRIAACTVISDLLDLVFGNEYSNDLPTCICDFAIKEKASYNFISLIDNVNLIDSQYKQEQDCYCQRLNETIALLTMNSYFNIKQGMSRWNSSIGDYLDLEPSWATIYYYSNGFTFERRENNVDCSLLPYDYSQSYNKVSLVVCDKDAFRLRKIVEIANQINIYTVPKLYKTEINGTICYFASCSNTAYSIDEVLPTVYQTIDEFDIFSLDGNLIVHAIKQNKDAFKF